MSSAPTWLWLAFAGFIVAMLALDLFVFHRDAHEVEFREATIYSSVWVGLGLLFGIVVWLNSGGAAAGDYYAGYLIEKALSVDNVFVFALLFGYFAIPPKYQHRLLFWGVVGALAMRGVFIALGAELLETYDFVIYIFGSILVFTGIRMAIQRGHHIDPSRSLVVRAVGRVVPVTDRLHEGRFFVRPEEVDPGTELTRPPLLGRWVATPLLVALITIEATDVVFAVDSIPAIFAITQDTFIVFTSNAFALLGLRALYFMLAGAITRFVYLQIGLSVVLVFVGVKFLISDVVGKVPIYISLPFIAGVVGISIAWSLWATRGLDSDEDHEPKVT